MPTPDSTRAPILLIHGLIGSLSHHEILSAFTKVPVLAPDLIGYGANGEEAPRDWTIEDQADYVANCVRCSVAKPVHVVGHSVGGVIGVYFAHRYPELTISVTSIEGNFSPEDAFWSMRISKMDLSELESEIASYRTNLVEWLANAGVVPTPQAIRIAASWLDNQPAATLRTQATAVIAATATHRYGDLVRHLLNSPISLHLIAGLRSLADWHVPEWVVARAASHTVIPKVGHLMMLEAPGDFASAIESAVY